LIKFAFIGGTVRGYKLIETLIENNFKPEYSVIMKEDDHEIEKHSLEIIALLKKHKLSYSVRKKLLPEDYKIIKKEKLDFAVVYGWRSIIDPVMNEYLKFGIVAAHHSLLPKYRGFAPVQWAVINGEKESGATLFKISNGEIDSGDIIAQKQSKDPAG
jgi:methionyl-tRNA formyltransferase